jgi:CheY-like chemotaxis protein
MNRRTTTWVRAGLSLSILAVAILRLAFFDEVGDRMDATFLLLLAAAAAAVLMPWERLTSLKAGGVEFSLEQPQVRGAVQALGLDRVADERLKDQIERLNADIEKARGSRVLWIDDKPHEIVGERRLLRALGIQITMVTSSEMAMEFLARDNDFDLLITDVQRQGASWEETGGVAIHEGANFVVRLRRHPDEVIRSLPVIFYAAYEWNRLVEYTRAAREAPPPEPFITNSVEALVSKTFGLLASVRANPIVVGDKKKPTSSYPGAEPG